MIASFKHRGLKALYDERAARRVAPEHVQKLRMSWLFSTGADGHRTSIFPVSGFHPLKGELKGHYAVAVSGNWRVTFRFEEGDVVDVDYLDYH